MPTLAVPFTAWVGLVSAETGQEVTKITYGNYARVPGTFAYCEDGITIANLTTLQWPEVTQDWGTVDSIQLWASATATDEASLIGSQLATDTVVTLDMYAIARIPASGILMTQQSSGRPYGTGAYGTGPYGTTLFLITPGVPLLITFDATTHACEAGTWTPMDLVA